MNILTKDKKVIKVQSAQIRVGANRHADRGWTHDVRIEAILPGGRKAHLLSHMLGHQVINLMPLYGYVKMAPVDPAVYLEFLRSIPVVSCDLFPIEVTPELEASVRAEAENICFCPAVIGQ